MDAATGIRALELLWSNHMLLKRTGLRPEVVIQSAFAYLTPLGLLLEARTSGKIEIRQSFDGAIEMRSYIEEYSGKHSFARDADSVLFLGDTTPEKLALNGALFTTTSIDWWGRPPAVYALLMPEGLLEFATDVAHYPPAAHVLESLDGRSPAPRPPEGQPGVDACEVRIAEFRGQLPPDMRPLLADSGHGKMLVSLMHDGSLMVTFTGGDQNSSFLPVELTGAPCGDAAFMFDGRLLAIESDNPKERRMLQGEQFHHGDGQSYSYLYPTVDLLEQSTLLARLD